MVLDDVKCWSIFTVILDNDTRASANLSWFAFFVDFAQSGPFTQFLAAVDSDQWDLMFIAKSSDELFVLWLIAAFGQNAQNGLTSTYKKKETVSLTSFWLLLMKSRISFKKTNSEFIQSSKVSSDPFSRCYFFHNSHWIQLTCPKLCRLDGFHELIHQRPMIF